MHGFAAAVRLPLTLELERRKCWQLYGMVGSVCDGRGPSAHGLGRQAFEARPAWLAPKPIVV
jgi:hypothetical protein